MYNNGVLYTRWRPQYRVASLGGGHRLGCAFKLTDLPIRDLGHTGNWTPVAEFASHIDSALDHGSTDQTAGVTVSNNLFTSKFIVCLFQSKS